MRFRSSAFLLPVCCLFGLSNMLVGCVSEESKRCDGAIKSSEAMLLSMNGGDRGSVEQTLASLQVALSACESARKTADVAEIKEAVSNLQAHLGKMESGKGPQAPQAPSAEEWAKLEQEGDERCPRGQSYTHPQKKDSRIVCRGPSVVEGAWKQNAGHYGALGYQLMQKGPILRAQRGQESLTFYYDVPDSDKAPKCVQLETAPGQTWEMAVSLATAVDSKLLKKGEAAPAKAGPFAFTVEETGDTFKFALGDCEAQAAEGAAKVVDIAPKAADVAAKAVEPGPTPAEKNPAPEK